MTDIDGYLDSVKSFLQDAKRGNHAASESLRESIDRLREIADSGSVDAQALVGGILLEYGKRPELAERYFRMAANSGSSEAMRGLGHMLANGIGCSQNIAEAMDLLELASSRGDLYAAFNLAVLLRESPESHDKEKALSLLEAASDGGIAPAQTLLGDTLAAGDRDDEALQRYLQAAGQDYAPAMYVAAQWYRDGVVGRPNLVEAARWFLKMLAVGRGDGIHDVLSMAPRMTDQELREAGRLASQEAAAEVIIAKTRRV